MRELCAVLDGELTQGEAAARMKARTRALARRQLTWMRKLPAAATVSVEGRLPAAVAADVVRLVQTRLRGRMLLPARRSPRAFADRGS